MRLDFLVDEPGGKGEEARDERSPGQGLREDRLPQLAAEVHTKNHGPERVGEGMAESDGPNDRVAVDEQADADHCGGTDRGGHQRDDRGRLAVAERVARPCEEQERAVREQSERE